MKITRVGRYVITHYPAPALPDTDEDLSHHPFIELMARWVREAERERLTQAQTAKPRRKQATASQQ